MEVYFATSNENKFNEACKILGMNLRQAKLNIPEIQSVSAAEVAEDKARKAYSILKDTVIVEDTALHIEAWNGFPGVMIKFMLERLGNGGICKALTEFNSRKAYAETCVAFFDGKNMYVFSGKTSGKISGMPKGPDIFGWDRIFIPKGYSLTFAEIGKEKKNKISHRSKAFLKLKKFLNRKYTNIQ